MHKLVIPALLLIACTALLGASAQSIAINAEGGEDLPDSIPVGETFTVLITEDGTPVPAGTNVVFTLPATGGTPIYVPTDSDGKARYKPLITGTLNIRVLDGTVTVAEATVNVEPEEEDTTPPTITSAIASPNAILSDGVDSTTLTVVATDNVGIESVTVNLSAIGGSDEQILDPAGGDIWETTINTTCNGTFELPVTVSDAAGNPDTANIVLTAGPHKYTLHLKQGWNMISLPYNVTAVGIDTTQKLGDVITAAGEPCYVVSWYNATSQMMESDIISYPEGVPQDATYPITGGQGYFVLVEADLDFVVAGTLW